MMISEFIERTGFEPTAAEYREIEAEYMGCDIDKDKFCRQWKKNGGIQRLSRQRVRRIEELEQQFATVQAAAQKKEEWFGNREAELSRLYNEKCTELKKADETIAAIRELL